MSQPTQQPDSQTALPEVTHGTNDADAQPSVALGLEQLHQVVDGLIARVRQLGEAHRDHRSRLQMLQQRVDAIEEARNLSAQIRSLEGEDKPVDVAELSARLDALEHIAGPDRVKKVRATIAPPKKAAEPA